MGRSRSGQGWIRLWLRGSSELASFGALCCPWTVLERHFASRHSYFSVHCLHEYLPDSLHIHIDGFREKAQDFYNACCALLSGTKFSVLAGIDANVTLPPHASHITGTSTLLQLASHFL